MSNARNISKAESRFVNATGDTMSGDITTTGDVISANLGTVTPSSLDDPALTPGFYKVSTGATGNPEEGNSMAMLTLPSAVSGGGQAQIAAIANNTNLGRIFVRHQANNYSGGVFNEWREVVTTANLGYGALEGRPCFCAYADTGTGAGWAMSGTSGTFDACSDEVVDATNSFNLTGDKFTAPVGGNYVFHFNMSLHGTDGTLKDNSLGYGFLKNGTKYNWSSYDGGLNNVVSASNFTSGAEIEISGPHLTAIIPLAANDYVQVGWQNMSKPLGVKSMVFSGYLLT